MESVSSPRKACCHRDHLQPHQIPDTPVHRNSRSVDKRRSPKCRPSIALVVTLSSLHRMLSCVNMAPLTAMVSWKRTLQYLSSTAPSASTLHPKVTLHPV